MPTLAIFIFGVVAIALGKWLYANPQKIFPRWWWPGPESQVTKDLARFLAILWVFVGSMAAALSINHSLSSGVGDPFLSLGIAFAFSWTTYRTKSLEKRDIGPIQEVSKRRPWILLIVMGLGTALTIFQLLIARPRVFIIWIVPVMAVCLGWILVLRVWKRELVR